MYFNYWSLMMMYFFLFDFEINFWYVSISNIKRLSERREKMIIIVIIVVGNVQFVDI